MYCITSCGRFRTKIFVGGCLPVLLGRRKTRHVDIRQIGCCDGLRACLSQCLGSSSLLDRAKKLRWDGELMPISWWQQPRMMRSYSCSLILACSFCKWLPGTGLDQDFFLRSHNDQQSCLNLSTNYRSTIQTCTDIPTRLA